MKKKINPVLDALFSGKQITDKIDEIKTRSQYVDKLIQRKEKYETELKKAKTIENQRYWTYRITQLQSKIDKYEN